MQVFVETVSELGRTIKISVPQAEVEEEVGNRLRKLARTVKVDGFRPGKVPLTVVVKHFSDKVRNEVARDLVETSYPKAIEEAQLRPAGYPSITLDSLEKGKDFTYSAQIEVFPEITFTELNNDEIEQIQSTVTDADVDVVVNKLREKNKKWFDVERASAAGDKVVIDFAGKLDGQSFEGGSAEDVDVIIGEGKMIAAFEEGLIGHSIGETFDMNTLFPAEYGAPDLAGKTVVFTVTLYRVMEPALPELDDEFAAEFDIKEGGIPALKKSLSENMSAQLMRQIRSVNREAIFEKFLSINPFEVPTSLIDQEIEHLKHDLYHRLFGHEHKENEKIPDFPRVLFADKAKKRVQLGLLLSHYAEAHNIKATEENIDAMIDTISAAYEDPTELKAWYKEDKQRLAEVEGLAVEQLVADKIAEKAKCVIKEMTYEQVMDKEAAKDEEGDE